MTEIINTYPTTHPICIMCDCPLTGKQKKYCSERCSKKNRKKKYKQKYWRKINAKIRIHKIAKKERRKILIELEIERRRVSKKS